MTAIELWGGVECTVNRVGDRFRDQTRVTGHQDRLEDLDLLCATGLSALRYPVLWERVSPDSSSDRDWAWTDERLNRLRGLGIRPIAGLVHHGSGPRYTDLLNDSFATGLAGHARAAAERYPWITDWTPVNEPVTTARFSALYGLWYPHARDERSFWLALLNQIDGVRLSMAAIRAVNSDAKLIQTDDLGVTHATPSLRRQAVFDNHRRWMAWDLLTGRVTRDHPLWRRLAQLGFADRLARIADEPCPPDVIGINHYLTSNRFLDDRLDRYPAHAHGGNRRQRYADVESIRVLDPAPQGFAELLLETWARYRLPVAITEAHNGCTREEQMRWLVEAWRGAAAARQAGADVRAVTAWAMFGSRGWNTLLTRSGLYESGIFDAGDGTPRPTALVPLLQRLSSGETLHPVVDGAGWWRRPARFRHKPVVLRRPAIRRAGELGQPHRRPAVILGATGTLGRALAAECRHRDVAHVLTDRAQIDLQDRDSIEAALDRLNPWVVINAAGWVRVDLAETEPDACMAVNARGAAALAEIAGASGIATVTFSSDLVFDGLESRPYGEADPPRPLNVYGHSKALAEQSIASLAGPHLIVRTAAFFSPFDGHNFAVHAVNGLRAGRPVDAAAAHVVSPTYVPDLCRAVLDLAIDGASGIWHLTNGAPVSWAGFARRIADHCALDRTLVCSLDRAPCDWVAARPSFAALGSNRGALMPSLDDALTRFAAELEVA